jgi:prepilin-type N-terminal cleavage/methylation domain-containing protein/prepilin-type processing-associated H-X9-DG protein
MSRLRSAFTLVELLVVIAIIGVLVALLLPAVQSAREAPRRTQCTNNLKQIALGTQNYGDVYSGVYTAGVYACCWGTWIVGLLPYVEQKALYDQYKYFGAVQNAANNAVSQNDLDTRYGGAMNLNVTKTQIPAYLCPSDPKTNTTAARGGITSHNYVANFGNTTMRRTATFGKWSTGQPNMFNGAPFVLVDSYATIPQSVRFAEVVDGTSNTLAFSETVKGQNNDLRGFSWWSYAAHFETFLPPNSSQPDIMQTISYCKPGGINPPCAAATTANPENMAARSRHPSGVVASFCDGSVKFISNNVAIDTWRAIGTIHGGESLGEY